MKEKIEFRKRREVGEVLNDSLLFTGQVIRPLLKSILYFCGPIIILGVLTNTIFARYFISTKSGPLNMEDFYIILVNTIFFGFLLIVVLIIIVFAFIQDNMNDSKSYLTTSFIWQKFKTGFWKCCALVFYNLVSAMIFYFTIAIAIGIFVGIINFLIPSNIQSFLDTIIIIISTIFLITFFTLIWGFTSFNFLECKNSYFKSINQALSLFLYDWKSNMLTQFAGFIIYISLIIVPYMGKELLNSPSKLFPLPFNLLSLSFFVKVLINVIFSFLASLGIALNLIIAGMQYYNIVEKKDAIGSLELINKMGEVKNTDFDEEGLYHDEY